MTRVVVLKDDTQGCWRLYTETIGCGGLIPAGERLRKNCQQIGNPWPIDSFTYTSKVEAEAAAKALEHYIETERVRRSQKRKRS